MKVALTVNDFLDRAATVYPDRIGIIDEADQPAASWGSLTYREAADRARAQAASLDGRAGSLGAGRGAYGDHPLHKRDHGPAQGRPADRALQTTRLTEVRHVQPSPPVAASPRTSKARNR
jgi:hypothetical protein